MEKELQFTGERFVPGKTDSRIEADHVERYRFASAFVAGKRVLDIACGSGYGAQIFEQAGSLSYLGVDISEESVQYARSRYSTPKSSFMVGDICRFSEKEQFDVVSCFETIEHITGYKQALRNLHAALVPGGKLIVSSPNRPVTSPTSTGLDDRPLNPYHTQEFTPEELMAEVVEAGFKVDQRNIYGQRKRSVLAQKLVRLGKHPDMLASWTSPKVSQVGSWSVARYFIIVAEKPRS